MNSTKTAQFCKIIISDPTICGGNIEFWPNIQRGDVILNFNTKILNDMTSCKGQH